MKSHTITLEMSSGAGGAADAAVAASGKQGAGETAEEASAAAPPEVPSAAAAAAAAAASGEEPAAGTKRRADAQHGPRNRTLNEGSDVFEHNAWSVGPPRRAESGSTGSPASSHSLHSRRKTPPPLLPLCRDHVEWTDEAEKNAREIVAKQAQTAVSAEQQGAIDSDS